ncbi:hypothetical protein ACFMQL_39155 [Nonomuraea fastidiosa]|jgi:hypothetical protein|uniref:hypothetical protein n=1 Tax=Nonomuraea TaxID=83681 RepID=UPI00324E5C2D
MTTPRGRAVPALLYVGAALTAIAALLPFFAKGTLADHIRAGYPAYTPGEIDAAVNAYLIILGTIGFLGLLGWFSTVWAVNAGKDWAIWMAVGLLVIALLIAIAGLTVKDNSGDVGLAPLFGWLLALPCVPGLAAVALWRRAR